MKSIWQELPKPFFCLAPMEDVTNIIFRQVVARASRPDVFFTEFMNVSGFVHPDGNANVAKRIQLSSTDKPIIVQIWGSKPEDFSKTASSICKLGGFAGIDINMGCPDKSVVKSGGGSALIKNPELAVEIIQAVKSSLRKSFGTSFSEDYETSSSDGVSAERFLESENLEDSKKKSASGKFDTKDFPISVKTRLGYSKIDEWESWLTILLRQNLNALTVHLRTKKEMSKVPAHHELIPQIIKLRDQIAPQTKLIINGDIVDRSAGELLVKNNPGIDGIMIGRGVFANPYCFEKNPRNHSKEELIDLLKYHLELFSKLWILKQVQDDNIKYEPLKKFFKIYINGFPGAKELRVKFMETKNAEQALELL